MMDFSTIREYWVERPEQWTCLGSPEEIDGLSETHKDQILFLNDDATRWLHDYFKASALQTGPMWKPFDKKDFKQIDSISIGDNTEEIKKWLYNRGIPFSKWVYVVPNFGNAITMTWKMIIKNSENLFFSEDLIAFDESLQWCLSYFHEDVLSFGTINIPDVEKVYREAQELNDLKQQYPNFKHPLRDE